MSLWETIVSYVLEKPFAPLSRMQAFTLRSICIEGLDMQPDGLSLRSGAEPKMLYAWYDGRYIGTAYGDHFDASTEAVQDPQVAGIVERIHEAYLSVEDDGRSENDRKLEELYDELII